MQVLFVITSAGRRGGLRASFFSENDSMVGGLPWTSWLLIVSPAVIGLGLALRFWYVHTDDAARDR